MNEIHTNSGQNLHPLNDLIASDFDLAFAPGASLNEIIDSDHFVQFYETDEFLVNSVREFISGGDAAIVVATREHREMIEKDLVLFGLDIEAARKKGLYVSLDAAETLSKFMVDGLPHRGMYIDVIGGLVKKVSKGKNKTRIFGEMVAILADEGNNAGAVALEELWNELQKTTTFTLFCAYPIKGFDGNSNADAFTHICNHHSKVLPSEGYAALQNTNKRLREIAALQQQARSLKAEITIRKEIEEELRLSELRYRRLFEASTDGHLVVDFKSRKIIDINPCLRNLLNSEKDELVGKKLSEAGLQPGKDLFKDLKKSETLTSEIDFDTKDGLKKFELVFNLYDENGKQLVQCCVRDVTERKMLEQQKDYFICAASHELKTPLTSQKAFIQLLQRSVEKTGAVEYERYISKIADQTDKLTRLVKDLLDGSKIQAGKLMLDNAPFDVNEILTDAIEEVQQTSSDHYIKLEGKVSKRVKCDKERISQVLTNLLDNAVKYSPGKNSIIVNVKELKNEVIVYIEDFGIGIAEKDQPFIFDRFHRGTDVNDNTYPGLGMGLYLSSEIIKLHKGKIWMESKKSEGSRFYFSIPI